MKSKIRKINFASAIAILFILMQNTASQSITNILGPNGLFTITDNTTTFLRLRQSDGYLDLEKSIRLKATNNSNAGIIYKGNNRFLHNYSATGTVGYNTFLGINAGNFSMNGSVVSSSYNTGIGENSLTSLTTGYYNTALGSFTLNLNTTGYENTSIGALSMYRNLSGYFNTAVGSGTLFFNTSGYSNISIGYYSLRNNTVGHENTAIGNNSMFSNISGYGNIAIGIKSLYYNTSVNNVAVGNYSLMYNISSQNIGVGNSSMFNNTTGHDNVAVGDHSLAYQTTGSYNTAFGNDALRFNFEGNDNVAIGYQSYYIGSTGNNNTIIGNYSGWGYRNGSNNTILGYRAGNGYNTENSVNNIIIGSESRPSSDNVCNEITLGNSSINVFRCNVTSITSLSDERDKKNIQDLSLGLDFLCNLKPRQFNWDKREWYEDNTSDGTKIQNTYTAGFIAQELDDIQVSQNAEWLNLVLKSNPEKLEATAGNLLPVIVKAVQELKLKCDGLELENNALRKQIETLELVSKKLANLEELVNDLKEKVTVNQGSQDEKVTNGLVSEK